MKKGIRLSLLGCLLLITLSLQSCLGFGINTGNFKTMTTSKGDQIGVNNDSQAAFKGKIYFTLDHNLYMLDGGKNLHQLTKGIDVRDPAVSPDGTKIAFIIRHDIYSDLAVMSSSGGAWRILLSGAGRYVPNPPLTTPKSTAHWYTQPAWAADNRHLLVLSDYMKEYWNFGFTSTEIGGAGGYDNPILDLQLFSLSLSNPTKLQAVAYAVIGDGGLRDPSYRPGHNDQIIYTGYKYDAATGTHQHVGLYLEDPNAIANNPGVYHPGLSGVETGPAIEITPDQDDLMNLEPTFSPDGDSLLYIRRNDATHMSLYTMPVPNEVTNNPDDQAVPKKALQAYSESSKLMTSQYLSQPIWSPDGKQILYIDYQNNIFDIWLANVAKNGSGAYSIQGTPIQLTTANGHLDGDVRPCWSR